MKRLGLLLAGIAAALSLIAPVAASASTSVGHAPQVTQAKPDSPTNSLLWNTNTEHYQGGDGNGNFIDEGTFIHLDMGQIGNVSSAACSPFPCGGGLNNTYNGDPFYVMYYHGSSTCVNMQSSFTVSSTSCGGGHPYSYWVKTAHAVDGFSGHSSWVNVGYSGQQGQGEYLYANNGANDEAAPYGYSVESFIWTN
jgi:hypothetical protein